MRVSQKFIDKLHFNLAFWLKRWERDPVAYAIEYLGLIPTYQQAKVLRALVTYRFVAAKSGHGIGKSVLAAIATNWYLDTKHRPDLLTRVAITGSGGSQLESTFWSELSRLNNMKWRFLKDQYTVKTDRMYNIENPNQCFAVLRTARQDNPDALAGFHDCLFIIDEASAIPNKIFEVARGAMGDPNCYGLMLGNPTKLSGYYYDAFQGSEVWKCFTFSSEDSLYEEEYSYHYVDSFGNLIEITHRGRQTKAWVSDMEKDFGRNSNVFKIRVLGEFASLGEDLVIEPRWTENIFTNPPQEDTKNRKRVMGVDVAWKGDDNSAVVIRQGNEVLFIQEWHGADPTETSERVQLIQQEWKCHKIFVDANGVGAGTYSDLKREKEPVVAVNVSETPPEDFKTQGKFKPKTLRDSLWWNSREFIRINPVSFAGNAEHEDWKKLKKELSIPTYEIKGGKIIVESKDAMRKRGLKSPNFADAFNMTMLYDREGKPLPLAANAQKKKKKKKRPNWKVI